MKYEEIIELLDAGFTREEIMKMEDPKPDDPKPDDPKPDDPKPDDPKPTDEILKGFADEVKTAIQDLTKEITAANIMASRQRADQDDEDVIAKIINPTIDKNGGM